MDSSDQIIVIGAGAAGMMAAGRAAELDANVLLLEKMERPGKKILLSGNGHCNLSNYRDRDQFIDQFGTNGPFLGKVFNRFFRDDLLALLQRYEIECKIEDDGRVYPVSENARDIVGFFQHYLEDGKVILRLGVTATDIVVKNSRVVGVSTSAGDLPASAVIIAAGGSSHPQTGSTGDGFQMASKLGHTIIKLRPGLVPLITSDVEQNKLWQGARLNNVRVTAFSCSADKIDPLLVPGFDIGRGITGRPPKPPIIESRTGFATVVHFGLSSHIILDMSLAIVDALSNGPVSVSIDLVPQKDHDMLRKELQFALDRFSQNSFRNIIRSFLPRILVKRFMAMTEIPPDKPGNRLTLEECELISNLLKSVRFNVKCAHSMSTSMVTAGGITLAEIHPSTMASRLVEGLFFAGEIMDIDAGTGGYNLQAAFSTGYVAGESAAAFVRNRVHLNIF